MEDPQLQLKLQITSVLCAALQAPGGAIPYLRENLKYHNLADCEYIENGPCPFLLCLTDSGAGLDAHCSSNKMNLMPTAYVAMEHSPERVDTSTVVHHFCGVSGDVLRELAPGVQVQLLASRALASLPLQSLFNLLGQGYEVVLTGQGWGGVVAHILASKLLLQLHQEIELAKKMGINLSALSQTEGKVVSFAYGSPLFGDAQLGRALAAHNLAGGLHTLWRKGDACGHFLTLASELAIMAEGSSVGARTDVKQHVVGFSLRSAQFLAVQHFAAAVAAGMAGMLRTKHIAQVAAPVDLQGIHSVVDEERGPASGGLGSAVNLHGGHGHDSPGSSTERTSAPAVSSPSSVHNSDTMPAASSSTAPKPSPLALSTGPTSGTSSPRRSPAGAKALTAVKAAVSAGAAVTAMGARSPVKSASSKTLVAPKPSISSPGSPVASRKSGQAGAMPAGTLPAVPASVVKAANGAGAGAGGAKGDAATGLVQQLGTLLALAGDAPHYYAPIGQFWILERVADKQAAAAPAPKPTAAGGTKAASAAGESGDAEARVRMVDLPPGEVVPTAGQWLSASNKELLDMWGTGMTEVQSELMEAFAWATFMPTSKMGDGQTQDRQALIRPTKSIELF